MENASGAGRFSASIVCRWAAALGLIAALIGVAPAVWAQADCDPASLIPPPVCGFDSFYGSPPNQVPVGWTAFVLGGSLSFEQDHHNGPGFSNLRMWSDGGTFKAGLYTQVRVTPGAGYRASVAFAAPTSPDTFGRQLGIDPTGGTDPTAPTVIWGPMHWGEGRYLNYPPGQGPNIDVRARARHEVITVFFLADHPRSTGKDELLVDGIMLLPDESAAPLPPTATSLPPARALAPPRPSPTPTALPSPSPTPSPTATPTASPTPTATDTPSPTPTPTPTTTPTPSPSPTTTSTPTPRPTATPTPGFVVGLLVDPWRSGRAPGLQLLDLGGLAGLGLAIGLFGWLSKRK
ncbi:MAG: hypothetical protein RMN24_08420 [Anaerolineae bacterium]|nr:hypothetical protein [Caldilineales bacterium]MCX7852019.1 hypothetical protein [Caldilineales bacterium]MDW8269174.1 hypothetical protein [Anaerolineae bacterium]